VREVQPVRTPENVVFEHELAGVPSRAAAWAIDQLVQLAILVAAMRVVSALGMAGGFAVALGFVALFLVQWWYFALSEWAWAGRTLGKRALGLRAVDARGLRIGFVQAVVRNLARIVDVLPLLYLVGGASALLDARGRRLGDLAAGTIVVRERPSPAPSAIVPTSARHDTFMRDPSVAIAVRRATAPERDAMIALGLRRESLPLGVRSELFSRLAAHLERRLGIARPAFFSPERYVLDLTAVLLARPGR
jgi:uncharacterized RDD family membrane protein YckC